ncbi:MAG: hypothetical protein NC098_01780 [Lachnoclostridium sp.]|nr:hypothetical protein [Lachnoclostridium sp.]
MNALRAILSSALALSALCVVSAQSLYDDIYYDSSKAKKTTASAPAFSYSTDLPAYYPADTYTVSSSRDISVDDYNRRGVFASEPLTADTTETDFTYTRRIESFYNPEIVSGSGDSDLTSLYYSEPTTVNIYVNTPSAYWGYDYFYPSTALAFGWGPFWSASWRWNSPWYWNSWYDPYWSWSWGWGPSWGWTWGWNRPGWNGPVAHWNPRHPGNIARPGYRPGNVRPSDGLRPGIGGSSVHRPGTTVDTGGFRPGTAVGATRPGTTVGTGGYRPATGTGSFRPGATETVKPGAVPSTTTVRPGTVNSGSRPGVSGTTTRPANTNTNNSYSRPANTNNNNYNYSRPSNTNGGRSGSFGSGSFGGSRGSGSSFGGSRGGGGGSAGGRGRH